MLPIKRIALDANVLIDLAEENEIVLDCIQTIRQRILHHQLIAVSTVAEELMHQADQSEPRVRRAAIKALKSFAAWKIDTLRSPVDRGITEQIALRLRRKGLIPDEEINDSLIVAECALAGVELLVTNDAHLKDLDHNQLKLVLEESDVSAIRVVSPFAEGGIERALIAPVVSSPRNIVRQFS